MKKFIKNIILSLLLFTAFINYASAAGSVSASLGGNSSVNQGSTINISINVGTVTATSTPSIARLGIVIRL